MDILSGFDIAVSRRLNEWAASSPVISSATVFLAVYFWYLVMAAVALVVIFSFLSPLRKYLKKNCEFFFFTIVSAFAARFVFTELIRFFYNRRRPFEVLGGIRRLVDHNGGGSFPSGHAALSFAVATAISFYYPKTSILFFAAALFIGLGRVAAGVHYPSDVLAGVFVGVVSAWLLRKAMTKFIAPRFIVLPDAKRRPPAV